MGSVRAEVLVYDGWVARPQARQGGATGTTTGKIRYRKVSVWIVLVGCGVQ